MAAAASSAVISWRPRRSRMACRAAATSGLGVAALAPTQSRGRRGCSGCVVGGLVAIGARPEAERANQRLDPGADGRVGDAQLALHVAEVAAGAEEALEQEQLLPREPPEPADAELALQGRAAGAAVEARHGQLAGADGTGGDDVVRHAVRFLPCVPLLSHTSFHFVNTRCRYSKDTCKSRAATRARGDTATASGEPVRPYATGTESFVTSRAPGKKWPSIRLEVTLSTAYRFTWRYGRSAAPRRRAHQLDGRVAERDERAAGPGEGLSGSKPGWVARRPETPVRADLERDGVPGHVNLELWLRRDDEEDVVRADGASRRGASAGRRRSGTSAHRRA